MQPATAPRARAPSRGTRAGLLAALLLALAWLGWWLAGPEHDAGPPAARDPAGTGAPAGHVSFPVAEPSSPALPAGDVGPMASTCPPLVLRGRVLDPDGQPLAGATVLLPQGMLDRSRWERATTGADGRYELAFTRMAPPGAEDAAHGPRSTPVEAEFDAAGHVPARVRAVFVGEEQRPASLDLTLAWRVAFAGRVLWSDGAPCADAAVQVERPVAPGARGWTQQGRQLAATRTDAQGAFRAGLAGGQVVEVLVDADGYAPHVPRRVALPPRGEAEVVLELPRPAALDVRLAGGADDALGGWAGRTPRLLLADPDAPGTLGGSRPLVSRDVTFEGVDPDVAWDLALALPSGDTLTLRSGLRLPAGGHATLEIALDDALLARLREPRAPAAAPTASFMWRLTDASGATLSLAECARRVEVGEGGRLRARARSLETGAYGDVEMDVLGTGTASGSGRLLGVPPPVELELQLGDSVLRHAPLGDGDGLVLVVPEPRGRAELILRASDAQGAARLPPQAWLWSLDRPRVRAVLPDRASATCTVLLPPGDWVVQSDPVGETGVQVRLTLAAGEVRTLELPGVGTGLVRGRIAPPPAEGELVLVQAQPDGAAAFLPGPQARAGADGGFELAGLAAGSWRLVALRGAAPHAPLALATQVVQLAAGRVTEASLDSVPDAAARPVRLRRAGATPGGVRLERLDDGLTLSWLLAPGDERRVLLPPGRWRLATLPLASEAWPSEAPRVTDFEVRPDDPPDELRLDA